MDSERRRHPRIAPQVGYFLSAVCTEYPDRPYSLSTRLLDISQSGARLETVGRLRERLPVQIDVRLPGEYARFRAWTSVAWSTSDRRDRHYAGLRFERVEEAADEPLPETSPKPAAEPRRRHKRYFPGRGDVTFAPRTLWTSVGFHPKNRAVRLVDVSPGGVQIIVDGRLEPGVVGDFTYDCSRPRVDLQAEARVVWCRRNTLLLTPEWHVGLAFRRVEDPSALKTLERHFLG
jgi:hypothetical protein